MSLLSLPLLIAALLVTTATAGPALLRAAAPLLMRAPRAAAGVLVTGFVAWLLACAALGMVLAWIFTGPEFLPGAYGEVCQRCLDASSPFAPSTTVETSLPIAILVALPVLAALLVVARGVRRAARTHLSARATVADITSEARSDHLAGHKVWLIGDAVPTAFALPFRTGGIVVSDGLRQLLSGPELAAVLAHESAHLRQRHHLLLTVMRAIVDPLRRVPLAAAISDAVPQYLEIAADQSARRRAGTPALASALLKIGQPVRHAVAGSPEPMLHVGGPRERGGSSGPERIRHLVAPAATGSALLPLAALVLLMSALSFVAVAVHGPSLQVLLAGCSLAG